MSHTIAELLEHEIQQQQDLELAKRIAAIYYELTKHDLSLVESIADTLNVDEHFIHALMEVWGAEE